MGASLFALSFCSLGFAQEPVLVKADISDEQLSAAEIIELLESEAERGDVEAQYRLAEMLYSGRSIETNPDEALEWFKKAAAGANVFAQEFLEAYRAHNDRYYIY